MSSVATEKTPREKAPQGRLKVADLRPGVRVESTFLLSVLEQKAKRNGEPFFNMTLGDMTGSVSAVMWENHANLLGGLVERDDFVRVEGEVGEFNGDCQIVVKRIVRMDDSEINPAEFLPTSPRPRAEMEAEFDAWMGRVRHLHCQRLLRRIFGHAETREKYCTAPAAARIHQAYIGGLLEHTLNVLRNAWQLAESYKPFDADVLITGAILHDIGKIVEYDWRRSIRYTDEGRLMGHISIGANMVSNAIRALQREPEGFDETLRVQILHLILSHHGKLEFGSPVTPKSREAFLLHYGDYTDAFLTTYADDVAKAMAKGESWTGYNKILDSYLYAGPSRGGAVPPPADGEPVAGFPRGRREGGSPDDPGN